MKNNIKKILNNGITLNTLKILAVIFMIVDHLAHYFWYSLPSSIYLCMRYLGRISMPLFLFALIQGFFHTKNFNKYFTRMFGYAVITQAVLTILYIINSLYFPHYSSQGVFAKANILFSFVLCLIIFKVLQTPILIKKYNKNTNIIIKILVVICILAIYFLIPFDYGVALPMLAICLYFLEKLRLSILISKSKINNIFNFFIVKSISDEYIKVVYIALVAVILIVFSINYSQISIWTLLALPIIALYNGQKGYTHQNIKYLYYAVFPVQHFIIYLIAMLLNCNN